MDLRRWRLNLRAFREPRMRDTTADTTQGATETIEVFMAIALQTTPLGTLSNAVMVRHKRQSLPMTIAFVNMERPKVSTFRASTPQTTSKRFGMIRLPSRILATVESNCGSKNSQLNASEIRPRIAADGTDKF
mmetsp:Transcript_7601/g.23050  ORF Transcript_7601/g.23050 Transcript_7601/m.23050 type:complete len:133 (-) Transcript_7601:363-761(-)